MPPGVRNKGSGAYLWRSASHLRNSAVRIILAFAAKFAAAIWSTRMRAVATLILVCLWQAPGYARADGSIRAERLRCEFLQNPHAVASPTPRLSWMVEAARDTDRGRVQTAYQVR